MRPWVVSRSSLSEDSDVEVVTDFASPTVVVRADRPQLVSAVANLLDNAIKYSSLRAEDASEVVVRLVDGGEDGVVEVIDHGIGIPETHIARIFERFYAVDRARSRSKGGTGLGLAIVRHVALNHGGAVEVESTFGVGSTFRFRVPKVAG